MFLARPKSAAAGDGSGDAASPASMKRRSKRRGRGEGEEAFTEQQARSYSQIRTLLLSAGFFRLSDVSLDPFRVVCPPAVVARGSTCVLRVMHAHVPVLCCLCPALGHRRPVLARQLQRQGAARGCVHQEDLDAGCKDRGRRSHRGRSTGHGVPVPGDGASDQGKRHACHLRRCAVAGEANVLPPQAERWLPRWACGLAL